MAGGRVRRRGARAPDAALRGTMSEGSTVVIRSTILSAMESFLARWEDMGVPNSKFNGVLSEIQVQLKTTRIDAADSELYYRLGNVVSEMGKANLLSRGDIRIAAIRMMSLLPTACFIAQPSDVLYFYARIAATCKDPFANPTEASVLLLALRTSNSLLSELHSVDRTLLRDAVRDSAAPFCDAIRSALFPVICPESRCPPYARISDSISSSREIDTDVASDFDQDEIDANSLISAADFQPSEDVMLAEDRGRKRDSAWSSRSRLRQIALDVLCSLASASSTALIPYWGLFLPERDGVNYSSSNFSRATLANIILHDPSWRRGRDISYF
jgi:hypothetical protein